MIKEIKKDEFKPNDLAIIMFYAEGCGACEAAKPLYEEISKKHGDIEFYKMQFDQEAYENIYNLYEEKTIKQVEEVKDEDGNPVLTKSGKPFKRHKLDDNGEIVKKSPIIVPNFFFFHPESAEGNDKLGFLGNVRGSDLQKVESIIEQMKEMENEDEQV